MAGESYQFEIADEWAGQRIDRALPSLVKGEGVEASRAVLQAWIKQGDVQLNGATVKPRQVLSSGDTVSVNVPAEEQIELKGEAMDLSILFEDDDVIVVDKPSGLVVHPASGNVEGTLVNALLHQTGGQLSRLADEDRPGIVHRLDKDTSGCLVAAKSDRAYTSLVAQFSERDTGKEYLAVTQGVPAHKSGTLTTRIGRHPGNRQKMAIVEPPAGKEAITDYQVLRADEEGKWALLSCVIHTGRTHQIRVHLKEGLHCPILGDVIYAQPKRQEVKVTRLMLHAWKLSFIHPSGKRMHFESEIPPEFDAFNG